MSNHFITLSRDNLLVLLRRAFVVAIVKANNCVGADSSTIDAVATITAEKIIYLYLESLEHSECTTKKLCVEQQDKHVEELDKVLFQYKGFSECFKDAVKEVFYSFQEGYNRYNTESSLGEK